MNPAEEKLERLFRAARAGAEQEVKIEAPFGFATRVVANWRANGNGSKRAEVAELLRLVRRVTVAAAIVTLLASGAAWWQLEAPEDAAQEPFTNVYAFADTAIESGLLP
jgi:hypothetical protein